MSRVEVRFAALLHSYTRGARTVRTAGETLGEVFEALDRRFPGIRFRLVDEQDRVRRHVRVFLNGADARDIATPLRDGDKLYIVGALSGG
jgi:molybdopterin converting factor small subunit